MEDLDVDRDEAVAVADGSPVHGPRAGTVPFDHHVKHGHILLCYGGVTLGPAAGGSGTMDVPRWSAGPTVIQRIPPYSTSSAAGPQNTCGAHA